MSRNVLAARRAWLRLTSFGSHRRSLLCRTGQCGTRNCSVWRRRPDALSDGRGTNQGSYRSAGTRTRDSGAFLGGQGRCLRRRRPLGTSSGNRRRRLFRGHGPQNGHRVARIESWTHENRTWSFTSELWCATAFHFRGTEIRKRLCLRHSGCGASIGSTATLTSRSRRRRSDLRF